MGKRDIRKREPKKSKKGARKPSTPISLRPLPDVDVIPKRKRKREEEPEE